MRFDLTGVRIFLSATIIAGLPVAHGGPLADAFSGQSMFVEDEQFQPPPECRNHAEYSTVFFNGQYHMYFRSFRNEDGSYGDIRGIGLATSADGNTWVAYNGGRPVYGNRTYTGSGGTYSIAIYAPQVIVEDVAGQPTLTMVYETMDYGNSGGGPTPRHCIEAAQSLDGINWARVTYGGDIDRKILVAQTPWEGLVSGQHRGNVGTPSIHKFNNNYYVFYHGYSGTDGANCLKRGFAYGTSITALMRSAANPVLQAPGEWGDAGIGRGDILKEDNFFYQVFEGLRYSSACGPTVTGWGLARSADLTSWEFSPRNPVRIDRNGPGCGEDMPSFQKIGSEVFVITVTSSIDEIPAVRRYKIAPIVRPLATSEIVAIAATGLGAGYWQISRTGKIFAFGAATSYGDAILPAGVEAIDIAATPSGLGYWVALSNGGVRNFGDATFFGSVENVSLAAPVRGLVPTSGGNGYWLYAGDGGVFTYGDAPFHGSLGGNPPSSPIVSMASRPSGDGYWMLDVNGSVYAFGGAPVAGSYTGGGAPAVEIIASTSGTGYWLVMENGNVYTYGAGLSFYGSTGGMMPSPIAGGALCRTGNTASGYWLAASDGGIIEYGSARYFGDVFFSTPTSGLSNWNLY